MIKLGPAGTSGLGYPDGLQHCKELGLQAMEIEFTYGVKMTNSQAKEVGLLAKKLNISLSVHCPYYINLNSSEKPKLRASVKRILDSCERGHHLGAKEIVFHPAYYQKKEKEDVFETVKEQIVEMHKIIKKNKWKVKLAPETTGKASQFGDIDELLKLKKQTSCSLCVDFAHLEARNNKKNDYDELFSLLKKNNVKHIHSHFSGIEYTAKGERRHKITQRNDLLPLLKSIIKKRVDITIINESPQTWKDCVKTKELIKELKK